MLESIIKLGTSSSHSHPTKIFPRPVTLVLRILVSYTQNLSDSALIPPPALTLSVSPEIKINGDLTVHIIPALTFGVNVLNGKAEADIFINLDTSASLAVNATGSVDLTKTFNTRSIRSRAGRIAAKVKSADIEVRDVSAGIQGCVAVGTGVSANVGAKGQFFSLFNADTSLPLFTKKFQLFSVSLRLALLFMR